MLSAERDGSKQEMILQIAFKLHFNPTILQSRLEIVVTPPT